jgi:hypothetical protein
LKRRSINAGERAGNRPSRELVRLGLPPQQKLRDKAIFLRMRTRRICDDLAQSRLARLPSTFEEFRQILIIDFEGLQKH